MKINSGKMILNLLKKKMIQMYACIYALMARFIRLLHRFSGEVMEDKFLKTLMSRLDKSPEFISRYTACFIRGVPR